MKHKYIHVTMPDGSVWAVPATVVAENRARYYSERDKHTTYKEEYDYSMSKEWAMLDWASSNMNWEDVCRFAHRVSTPNTTIDYQEGWINGAKEIVES